MASSSESRRARVRNMDGIIPGGNLQPALYRASTAEGFAVLPRYWHKHGLPALWLRKVTWLKVVHRYWRSTGHRYHASTEICNGSVLALLQSRLLADTVPFVNTGMNPTFPPGLLDQGSLLPRHNIGHRSSATSLPMLGQRWTVSNFALGYLNYFSSEF